MAIDTQHDNWPVVVLANDYQFTPGQRNVLPRVESRMLVWCISGRGTVRVNGTTHSMAVSDFLFLPWRHAITYNADERDPFLVAGVHIIPNHSANQPVVFSVAHHKNNELANNIQRKDKPLPGLEGVLSGTFIQRDELRRLAEYIVYRFQRGEVSEAIARLQASLLLAELSASFRRGFDSRQQVPPHLRSMLRYVRDHLQEKITLEDLAAFSKKSKSTVCRLFRQHLDASPVEWILRERMQQACHMLATTPQAVGKVGRRVGVEDPYYFSKTFKKIIGLSPLAYRRRTAVF